MMTRILPIFLIPPTTKVKITVLFVENYTFLDHASHILSYMYMGGR